MQQPGAQTLPPLSRKAKIYSFLTADHPFLMLFSMVLYAEAFTSPLLFDVLGGFLGGAWGMLGLGILAGWLLNRLVFSRGAELVSKAVESDMVFGPFGRNQRKKGWLLLGLSLSFLVAYYFIPVVNAFMSSIPGLLVVQPVFNFIILAGVFNTVQFGYWMDRKFAALFETRWPSTEGQWNYAAALYYLGELGEGDYYNPTAEIQRAHPNGPYLGVAAPQPTEEAGHGHVGQPPTQAPQGPPRTIRIVPRLFKSLAQNDTPPSVEPYGPKGVVLTFTGQINLPMMLQRGSDNAPTQAPTKRTLGKVSHLKGGVTERGPFQQMLQNPLLADAFLEFERGPAGDKLFISPVQGRATTFLPPDAAGLASHASAQTESKEPPPAAPPSSSPTSALYSPAVTGSSPTRAAERKQIALRLEDFADLQVVSIALHGIGNTVKVTFSAGTHSSRATGPISVEIAVAAKLLPPGIIPDDATHLRFVQKPEGPELYIRPPQQSYVLVVPPASAASSTPGPT